MATKNRPTVRNGGRPISDFDVDKWRYRCPDEDCRSTTISVRRLQGHRAEHVEWKGTLRTGNPHVHRFYCESCTNTFDEPYDAKEGEQRHVELDK